MMTIQLEKWYGLFAKTMFISTSSVNLKWNSPLPRSEAFVVPWSFHFLEKYEIKVQILCSFGFVCLSIRVSSFFLIRSVVSILGARILNLGGESFLHAMAFPFSSYVARLSILQLLLVVGLCGAPWCSSEVLDGIKWFWRS